MNKKILITIIVIALIVALAIFTGAKLSKGDTNNTSTNPVDQSTARPNSEISTPIIQTSTPEGTATPIATTTPTSVTNEEIKGYSVEQKKEYAKSIAKETWEKLGVQKKVYYSFGSITSDGKYIIAVREEATTKELVWYEIDINNKTCKEL